MAVWLSCIQFIDNGNKEDYQVLFLQHLHDDLDLPQKTQV